MIEKASWNVPPVDGGTDMTLQKELRTNTGDRGNHYSSSSIVLSIYPPETHKAGKSSSANLVGMEKRFGLLKATDIYSNPNVIDCRPGKRWKCVDCGMMVYSCDRPLWKHFKKEKGKCIHSFWLQVTMEGERLETMEDVTLDTVHSGKD